MKTVADYPKLIIQWHPTKNGLLLPQDVSYGSDKRCWWKCPVADDHEWDACVSSRTITGSGCPFCRNQKVCRSNCLVTTYPKLAAEWHPTNNGNLAPNDVTAGACRKVWWKCPVADDHEWEASIVNRSNPLTSSGCPCCTGRKVVLSNCLATQSSHLVSEWHDFRNGTLTPYDITNNSKRKVWWKCSHGHEWEAVIDARSRGSNCPYCTNKKVCQSNCLATTHPKLAAEWHPIKNGDLTPFDVVPGSGIKIWWKCSVVNDHEWEATISSRSRAAGCPFCSNQKVSRSNCLATTHPELVFEWHVKNTITPNNVTYGSGMEVWWKCSIGHEWQATVSSRTTSNQGCPYCARKRACEDNCLAATHPELAAQWHSVNNKTLTAQDVLAGSGRTVWWKCPVANDHEWEEVIQYRTGRGFGCPYCSSNRLSVSNSLFTVNPELAAEWHPTKNGDLTPSDVIAKSGIKVWWKCPVANDHEWEASPANRSNKDRNGGSGSGCPYCWNRKVSQSNCLATTHPKLAAEWHPTKNGDLTPADVTMSKKQVWWKCSIGHEWQAYIFSRIRDSRGCPYCANQKVCQSNCLATLYPNLVNEWHPTKNGGLTPNDVTAGSNAFVWWKCPVADDHEWEAPVCRRSNKESSCPCCSGIKVVASNCLATTHPELAIQWHPTKNGILTPKNVIAGGAAKVWWKCEKNHDWMAQLATRKGGCGCPVCNESKGEKIVASILQKHNILFARQTRFNECRLRNRLPFDFSVNVNNKICLIEFQGEQHYRPVSFGSKHFDAQKQFKLVKKRDKIKKMFCRKHQIPFLAIPYWEIDKAEKIVTDFLASCLYTISL